MEKFQYENTIDQTSELLNRLIRVAKDNAIPVEDYNRDMDNQGLYEHAKIHVRTLPEFKMLLEKIGMQGDSLIDSLEHENAHANKAEELGARHEGYQVLCLRYKNGFGYIPQVSIYIPDRWSLHKQKEVSGKIINAPEEYGNSLSPDDINDLKN